MRVLLFYASGGERKLGDRSGDSSLALRSNEGHISGDVFCF